MTLPESVNIFPAMALFFTETIQFSKKKLVK